MNNAEREAIADVAASLAIAANNAGDREAVQAGLSRALLRGLQDNVWEQVYRLRAMAGQAGVAP
jgi:hypothetical protein